MTDGLVALAALLAIEWSLPACTCDHEREHAADCPYGEDE